MGCGARKLRLLGCSAAARPVALAGRRLCLQQQLRPTEQASGGQGRAQVGGGAATEQRRSGGRVLALTAETHKQMLNKHALPIGRTLHGEQTALWCFAAGLSLRRRRLSNELDRKAQHGAWAMACLRPLLPAAAALTGQLGRASARAAA